MIDVPTRASVADLEKIAGFSEKTIRKHIRQQEIPKGKRDGLYNTEKVLSAIVEAQKRDTRNQGDAGDDVTRLKARKIALECQRLELFIQHERREVITRAQHIADLQAAGAIVQGGLRQLRDRMAAKFRKKTITQATEQICREILQAMAEQAAASKTEAPHDG